MDAFHGVENLAYRSAFTDHRRSYIGWAVPAGPRVEAAVGAPAGFSLLLQRLLYQQAIHSNVPFDTMGGKLGFRVTAEELACFISGPVAMVASIDVWLANLIKNPLSGVPDPLGEVFALQDQLAFHQRDRLRRRWTLHPLPISAPDHVSECDITRLAELEIGEMVRLAKAVFALGLGVMQFGRGLSDQEASTGERWTASALFPEAGTTFRGPSMPASDRVRVSGLALLPGRNDANYLSGLAYAAGLQFGRRAPAQRRFHQALNLEGMSIDFQPYSAGSLLMITAASPAHLADEVLDVISDLVQGLTFHPAPEHRRAVLAHSLGQAFDSPVERAIEDATRLLTGQVALDRDLEVLNDVDLVDGSECLKWSSVVTY